MSVTEVRQTSEFARSITVEQLDRDPYPVFARLRVEDPVAYVPAVNSWLVSRWHDIECLYTETSLVSARMPHSPSQRTFGSPNILTVEGDIHEELRNALTHILLPRVVDDYVGDLVRPIVERRIAAVAGRRDVDLMREYFEPISVRSLGDLLGLGDISESVLHKWFSGLSVGSDNWENDPRKNQISDSVVAEITEHLEGVYDRVERSPDQSLISALVHGGNPAGGLRDRRMVTPTVLVIILGGLQEPGHGAGSLMMRLFEHPDQLDRIIADPSLLPKAVNEGLRYDPPAGTMEKAAQADFEFRGKRIRKGDSVVFLAGSANRDEFRFSHSEQFDIARKESVHKSFGMAHHMCMGHWFSRRQIEIAVGELLRAFPGIGLADGAVPVARGWVFRAPREGLRVDLDH